MYDSTARSTKPSARGRTTKKNKNKSIAPRVTKAGTFASPGPCFLHYLGSMVEALRTFPELLRPVAEVEVEAGGRVDHLDDDT